MLTELDTIGKLLESSDASIDLPNGLRVCWVTPTADDSDCWLVVGDGLEGAFRTALEAVRFALGFQKGMPMTTPTEPTPLWGPWSDEKQRWRDTTHGNFESAEWWLASYPGFRAVKLVPAGSETAAVLPLLIEAKTVILSLGEYASNSGVFFAMKTAMEFAARVDALIAELESKGG